MEGGVRGGACERGGVRGGAASKGWVVVGL